ncbi:MAG: restriction endonuclease [Terriglobia bacterium]|jgi:hypothetical protein
MNWLDTLSGIEFEGLITRLLERMGFRAEMTKASGDGGVDVVATLDHPLTGGRYLIQCKRYAPDSPVGAATVREFYGALTADRRAVKGILITTSGFTVQAQEFVRGLPIELIGRDQLEPLLARYGLDSEALSAQKILKCVEGYRKVEQLALEAAWVDGKAVVRSDGKDLSPHLSNPEMMLWLAGYGIGWNTRMGTILEERVKMRRWMESLNKARALLRQVTVAQAESALGPPESRVGLGENVLYNYADLTVEFHDGKVADVR